MKSMEIKIARVSLTRWKAELAQKKLFLEVFALSGNKSGMDITRDHIFDLECKIRMMKEALKHVAPKKSTIKKKGRK